MPTTWILLTIEIVGVDIEQMDQLLARIVSRSVGIVRCSDSLGDCGYTTADTTLNNVNE